MRETERRDQQGTITLFFVGTIVAVLFLGGLSLDMWRFLAARRHLSAVADSVALAAADGLDPASLRNGGTRLDPQRARRLALSELASQRRGGPSVRATVVVTPSHAVVRLSERVGVTLLGLLAGRTAVDVRVSAAAAPRRHP